MLPEGYGASADLILDRERAAFAQDKSMLEGTIVDITRAEASSQMEQAFRESECREQTERARCTSFSSFILRSHLEFCICRPLRRNIHAELSLM